MLLSCSKTNSLGFVTAFEEVECSNEKFSFILIFYNYVGNPKEILRKEAQLKLLLKSNLHKSFQGSVSNCVRKEYLVYYYDNVKSNKGNISKSYKYMQCSSFQAPETEIFFKHCFIYLAQTTHIYMKPVIIGSSIVFYETASCSSGACAL